MKIGQKLRNYEKLFICKKKNKILAEAIFKQQNQINYGTSEQ